MYQTFEEVERITNWCIYSYSYRGADWLKSRAVKMIQDAKATGLLENTASLDVSQVLDSAAYKPCEGNVNMIIEYGSGALPPWQKHRSNLTGTSHGHNTDPEYGNFYGPSLVAPSLVAFSVNVNDGRVDLLTDYDRRINIVVTLKNRGPLLIKLLDTLKQEIATSTLDVFITICDFKSDDIDVSLQLANSGIPHRLIQVGHGRFSKVIGLQKLIASARDSDVIFIADVDYYIPEKLLLMILKYTKQGLSAYMPIPWYFTDGDYLDEHGTVKPECCSLVGLPPGCKLPAFVLAQNASTLKQMQEEMHNTVGWAAGGYGKAFAFPSAFSFAL